MAKKITSKAIGQMREILSGIVLGKLKHNQSSWHCGTAACVAGWNTNLNHRSLLKKGEKFAEEAERSVWDISDLAGARYYNDGELAQQDWKLTDREADFMFAGTASLAEQIGMIEFLADGRRYDDWDDYGEAQTDLQKYVERYESKTARLKWAKQYEQPRPNADIVKDLLCAKPVKEQMVVVEEIVETRS